MEEFLLALLMITVFIIGYFFMKGFDQKIEHLQKHSPTILIVSNKEFDYDSRYAYFSSTLIENFNQFNTIILNGESDFENLMMNEKIHNQNKKIKIYAKVNKLDYINLYHKSNISTYSNHLELKNILEHLYDQ